VQAAGRDPSGVADDVKQAWGHVDTELFDSIHEKCGTYLAAFETENFQDALREAELEMGRDNEVVAVMMAERDAVLSHRKPSLEHKIDQLDSDIAVAPGV
jgi:hypothetical protein